MGFWGFLSQIPSILISPIADVWAYRWNWHHLLIITQILASVLAILVLIGFFITEIQFPYVHGRRRSINWSPLSGFRGWYQRIDFYMIITVHAVSISLMLFAYSNVMILIMLLMLLMGLCMMFQMATSNTLLQSHVMDGMRGRVLSLYPMAPMSILPLGSIAIGTLDSKFGMHWSLAACDVVCILWSLCTIPISPSIIISSRRMLVFTNNRSLSRTLNGYRYKG